MLVKENLVFSVSFTVSIIASYCFIYCLNFQLVWLRFERLFFKIKLHFNCFDYSLANSVWKNIAGRKHRYRIGKSNERLPVLKIRNKEVNTASNQQRKIESKKE